MCSEQKRGLVKLNRWQERHTLATVQYEQYVAEKIITLFLMTRFLKFSADCLTSSLNFSCLPSALTASVLAWLF